jgi:DNA-binding transcriptional MocR family regulator
VAQLVAEGILSTRPGAGTFVARPADRPVADTAWQQVALGASPVDPSGLDLAFRLRSMDGLSLAGGYLDEALRSDARVASAIARAARRPGAWGAPPMMGVPELRHWFATEIGVDCDEVLVTSGGQSALSATMRAIIPSGSPVLFETPTYPGALAVARSAGLVPIPVPLDAGGIRVDLLERAFRTTGARVMYLQPTFANPGGTVLDKSRRGAVIDAAAAAGAFIIEDDWAARWLSHGAVPPPPLIRNDPHGHVITLTSLTKATAPSLRVGAIAARGPVLQRIANLRLVDEHFMSRPLQEASVELVTSSAWRSQLRTVSAALRDRAAALAAAVARHLPEGRFTVPGGGISLWLELPGRYDESLIAERSASMGVAVLPGHIFKVGESNRSHLRLAYAAIQVADLDRAVTLLGRAVLDSAPPRT